MKVQTIEHQIKNLISGENDFHGAKKLQIKQFLENFERDKSNEKEKYKKWEVERDQRFNHFSEAQKKYEDKRKEEVNKQKEEVENKKKEEHKHYFEKMVAKNQENKEKAMKNREIFKNNKILSKHYKYEILEEQFRLKQQKLEEEKFKIETLNKLKRKNELRPIRKEQLDEFERDYLERKQEMSLQKEKERLLKQDELFYFNSNYNKPESEFYKKVLKEEKENKDIEERKKVEKIYINYKVRNFSKVVNDNLLPKIDDAKRKEIEDRINKNKIPHQHYKRKNYYNVVLLKKSLNKEDLKEDLLRPQTTNIDEGDPNDNIQYYETQQRDRPCSGMEPKKLKPVEIRKPLDKQPDYLIEMRLKKSLEQKRRDDHHLTGNMSSQCKIT